jgi:hypothetical protein
MIRLAVGLVLPCLSAYWGIANLAPRMSESFRLVRLSLAVCLGIGLSACVYFLAMLLDQTGPAYFYVESGVFALLAAAGWWGQRRSASSSVELPSKVTTLSARPILAWILTATCAAATVLALRVGRNVPDGFWDAWYNWNHKARFLYHQPAQWRDVLSEQTFALPDYPLLLPTLTARTWRFWGDDPLWLSQAIGFVFLAATVGVFVGTLRILRGASQACLGGAVLLGLVPVVDVAMFQCADMPVACYFLAATALAALYDGAPENGRGLLALSGLSAGLAAWTKNEGWLLIVVVATSRCFMAWRRPWRTTLLDASAWLAGLAPPVLLTLYFKRFLAPATHLVAAQGWELTQARWFDLQRHLMVFDYLLGRFIANPFLLMIVLPLGWLLLGRAQRRTPGLRAASCVFWLMALGYYATYVATPYDLRWHVSTSIERLFIQLWPLGLFAFFLSRATPEELLAAEADSPPHQEELSNAMVARPLSHHDERLS